MTLESCSSIAFPCPRNDSGESHLRLESSHLFRVIRVDIFLPSESYSSSTIRSLRNVAPTFFPLIKQSQNNLLLLNFVTVFLFRESQWVFEVLISLPMYTSFCTLSISINKRNFPSRRVRPRFITCVFLRRYAEWLRSNAFSRLFSKIQISLCRKRMVMDLCYSPTAMFVSKTLLSEFFWVFLSDMKFRSLENSLTVAVCETWDVDETVLAQDTFS